MPRIFISYRRADSQAITGRVHEHLAQVYGDANVFRDVTDIPYGVNFKTFLENEIAKCDVMLVMIGRQWATITGDDGARRLDDPGDFVRLEVEAGLKRGEKAMRVIPVLVDGQDRLPRPEALPASLSALHLQNATQVRYDPDFEWDMQRLVKQIGVPRRRTPLVIAAAIAALAVLIVLGVLVVQALQPQAPGGPIAVGDVRTGELTAERGFVDYTIELNLYDAITVTMLLRDESLDPQLAILAPNGMQLDAADDSAPPIDGDHRNARIARFVAPADGRYTIRASSWGSSTGGYEISVTQAQAATVTPTPSPSPTVTPATPQAGNRIAPEQRVQGEITVAQGVVDYVIDLRAGQIITVTMIRLTGDLDTYLSILGPDGQQVAVNDDAEQAVADVQQNAQIVGFAAPQDGTYTVRATRYGTAAEITTGRYELTVISGLPASLEPSDTPTPQPEQPSGESGAVTPIELGQGIGAAGAFWEVYFSAPTGSGDASTYAGGIDTPLIAAINDAARSLDIAAFEFDSQAIGEAVLRAERHGVRVRIVTDDENGRHAEDSVLPHLVDSGITVVDDGRGAFMHDSFMIVDGREVWTGSWNPSVNSLYRNNANLLRLQSRAVVESYQAEFNEMFGGHAFGPQSPANTPDGGRFTEGEASGQVIFMPEDDLLSLLLDLIRNVRSSIRFMSFSFTADEIGEALAAQADRGRLVQGIFESVGSRTSASELQAMFCGVMAVRVDGNRFLMNHKVVIFDDDTVLVGSANLSANAMESNDENAVLIRDPALAAQYLAEFERLWATARLPEGLSCQ